MIIFTKFHKDKTKIVDVLLIVKLQACTLILYTPSIYLKAPEWETSKFHFYLGIYHHYETPRT